jgi:hypothetical protein
MKITIQIESEPYDPTNPYEISRANIILSNIISEITRHLSELDSDKVLLKYKINTNE